MSEGQVFRAVAWAAFGTAAALELAAIWMASDKLALSGAVFIAVAYITFLAQIGKR